MHMLGQPCHPLPPSLHGAYGMHTRGRAHGRLTHVQVRPRRPGQRSPRPAGGHCRARSGPAPFIKGPPLDGRRPPARLPGAPAQAGQAGQRQPAATAQTVPGGAAGATGHKAHAAHQQQGHAWRAALRWQAHRTAAQTTAAAAAAGAVRPWRADATRRLARPWQSLAGLARPTAPRSTGAARPRPLGARPLRPPRPAPPSLQLLAEGKRGMGGPQATAPPGQSRPASARVRPRSPA